MNNRQFFGFCMCIVFIASAQAQTEAEFAYDKNTFIKYNDCLGVYPGTSLGLTQKVWVFSMEQAPVFSEVVHIISAAKAQKKFDEIGFSKVLEDKPLWTEIRCASSFRGDMPESLARVTPDIEDTFVQIGFAIRGLPASAWIAGGKGDSVAMDVKDNPYVKSVRNLVTEACYVPDSLIRMKQFPIRKGRSIIQLDIGKVRMLSPKKKREYIEEEMRLIERMYEKRLWHVYKQKKLEELGKRKDFIESVEICRFFLDEKRVVKTEKISRHTSVDERVDTPTDLDSENWADTTDSAIGFISLNEGKDWDVLLVDVGFEGINYSIQRLDGSVVHYNRSLYTHH